MGEGEAEPERLAFQLDKAVGGNEAETDRYVLIYMCTHIYIYMYIMYYMYIYMYMLTYKYMWVKGGRVRVNLAWVPFRRSGGGNEGGDR